MRKLGSIFPLMTKKGRNGLKYKAIRFQLRCKEKLVKGNTVTLEWPLKMGIKSEISPSPNDWPKICV